VRNPELVVLELNFFFFNDWGDFFKIIEFDIDVFRIYHFFLF
jgi:hypothetical protein